MSLEEYRLIDQQADLEQALDWLRDLDPVGVDVERADWDRYYRTAALVQVGGDGRVALLDPLGLDDWAPVQRYFAEREIILHALENDTAPLEALGVVPPVIHDTAIAAALLGLPTGLESLMEQQLGIFTDSNKSKMQRAAWEARPMSDEMLVYAAEDVADLPELWLKLRAMLEEAGRWDWYVEEVTDRIAQPGVEERRDWTRTKGVGRLNAQARARVHELWETRERLAKDTDTAPGRIVNDKTLLDLAAKPPASARELGRRGVRRRAIRDFGDELVAAIERGQEADPEPAQRSGRRTTESDRELADELRVLRAEIAEAEGLDAGLLCPSRQLLKAVASDPQTPEEFRAALGLRNWQWSLLEEAFTDALFEPLDDEPEEPAPTS